MLRVDVAKITLLHTKLIVLPRSRTGKIKEGIIIEARTTKRKHWQFMIKQVLSEAGLPTPPTFAFCIGARMATVFKRRSGHGMLCVNIKLIGCCFYV